MSGCVNRPSFTEESAGEVTLARHVRQKNPILRPALTAQATLNCISGEPPGNNKSVGLVLKMTNLSVTDFCSWTQSRTSNMKSSKTTCKRTTQKKYFRHFFSCHLRVDVGKVFTFKLVSPVGKRSVRHFVLSSDSAVNERSWQQVSPQSTVAVQASWYKARKK
jgi:hypothetical protein